MRHHAKFRKNHFNGGPDIEIFEDGGRHTLGFSELKIF